MLLLLAACAPDFDQSRKDLVDFRLLGMRVEAGVPEAAVWSGEGAFHATAPALTWTEDEGGWDLHVEDAGGRTEDGRLDVEDDHANPVVDGFTRDVVGTTATLSVGGPDGAYTRWAATSGTFTETGPHAATWEADGDGLATVFALTLDGEGGVSWTWIDVAVNDEGPYLQVGARLLPVDAAPAGDGPFLATISAADNLAGVVFTELEAGTGGDVVCGLDPFDADALVDGRCGLDDAIGARVAVTP